MRLVYKESGAPAKLGDTVEVGGLMHKLIVFQPPSNPDSEGRVWLVPVNDYGTVIGASREYPVSAIEAEWIEREDRPMVFVSTSEPAPASVWPYPSIEHKDLIRAVLDGKLLQHRRKPDSLWRTTASPKTAIEMLLEPAPGCEYRAKPEPVVRYIGMDEDGNLGTPGPNKDWAVAGGMQVVGKAVLVLRIETDLGLMQPVITVERP